MFRINISPEKKKKKKKNKKNKHILSYQIIISHPNLKIYYNLNQRMINKLILDAINFTFSS